MQASIDLDLHRLVHSDGPQAIKYGNKFHLRRSRLSSQEKITRESMTEYSNTFTRLKQARSLESLHSGSVGSGGASSFGIRAHYVPKKLPKLKRIYRKHGPPWSGTSDPLDGPEFQHSRTEFDPDSLAKRRVKCASHPPPKQELQISFASAADLHEILDDQITTTKLR